MNERLKFWLLLALLFASVGLLVLLQASSNNTSLFQ